mmetsp:Transcript_48039/g.141946  ORF Transcript_48039/g.141946 Transcript_48039/m.141946 type:complete len:357 (+) Transcript_48039:885-1955(+)
MEASLLSELRPLRARQFAQRRAVLRRIVLFERGSTPLEEFLKRRLRLLRRRRRLLMLLGVRRRADEHLERIGHGQHLVLQLPAVVLPLYQQLPLALLVGLSQLRQLPREAEARGEGGDDTTQQQLLGLDGGRCSRGVAGGRLRIDARRAAHVARQQIAAGELHRLRDTAALRVEVPAVAHRRHLGRPVGPLVHTGDVERLRIAHLMAGRVVEQEERLAADAGQVDHPPAPQVEAEAHRALGHARLADAERDAVDRPRRVEQWHVARGREVGRLEYLLREPLLLAQLLIVKVLVLAGARTRLDGQPRPAVPARVGRVPARHHRARILGDVGVALGGRAAERAVELREVVGHHQQRPP